MNGAEKNISEIFLEQLRDEKKMEDIIHALQYVDKLLKESIGKFKEEKAVIHFFFNVNSSGRLEKNLNHHELMEFWKVFILFENITREERWKFFSGEPFIIETIFQIILWDKWHEIKDFYLGWNEDERKELHNLLKQVFDRSESRLLCIVELVDKKMSITKQFHMDKAYRYTDLNTLLSERNLERLNIIIEIFKKFKTVGIIILTTKQEKQVKNEGVWIYKKHVKKIPRDIMKLLLENI